MIWYESQVKQRDLIGIWNLIWDGMSSAEKAQLAGHAQERHTDIDANDVRVRGR
jgi:hypothetical protein